MISTENNPKPAANNDIQLPAVQSWAWQHDGQGQGIQLRRILADLNRSGEILAGQVINFNDGEFEDITNIDLWDSFRNGVKSSSP